jgi:hypothetical protein
MKRFKVFRMHLLSDVQKERLIARVAPIDPMDNFADK